MKSGRRTKREASMATKTKRAISLGETVREENCRVLFSGNGTYASPKATSELCELEDDAAAASETHHLNRKDPLNMQGSEKYKTSDMPRLPAGTGRSEDADSQHE